MLQRVAAHEVHTSHFPKGPNLMMMIEMARDLSFDLVCRKHMRVAVCCSVLQCVAICLQVIEIGASTHGYVCVLQCVAVCCSVLQCVCSGGGRREHSSTSMP